jgi:hypothetical protein
VVREITRNSSKSLRKIGSGNEEWRMENGKWKMET